jgi:hypothetical protein
MVPNSTIERKIMSTKTSIKRIALVAAAALTLGGFSAVSASAGQTAAQLYVYCSNADGGAISNTTTTGAACNGVAGPVNTVTLTTVNTAKDLFFTVSGAGATFNTASGVTLNTAATSAGKAAASSWSITLNTPTAGTVTVKAYAATAGSGIYTDTLETVVITVATAAASGVYSAANTTAYIVAGETSTAAADATVVAPKTYAATESATASIVINYLDANGTGSAIRDTLTATITSGGGTLAAGTVVSGTSGTAYADAVGLAWDSRSVRTFNAPTVNYSTSLRTDASGNVAFLVMANGVAGVSTITVKNSAGVVVTTKTLTFTGTDVSSITLTAAKNFVNGDTASGPTSKVLTAVLKDSAGNIVTGLAWSPTVTYSVATLGAYRTNGGAGIDTATSDTTGTVTYGWTAPSTVAYGPVTITLTDPTTKATASATITISSAVAATVSASAPTVDLGNTFSYTVTAKDSNGYAIPDGSVASNYISSVTSNGGIGAADLTSTSTGGVFTLKVTGPVVSIATGSGAFLLTGTAGTANSYLAKTLTGTTVTASFAVNGTDGSSLAYDAASAATDAANNAYEEAQNATQAASDALAAVKALAVQVKALIALVNKIKAKLKA